MIALMVGLFVIAVALGIGACAALKAVKTPALLALWLSISIAVAAGVSSVALESGRFNGRDNQTFLMAFLAAFFVSGVLNSLAVLIGNALAGRPKIW